MITVTYNNGFVLIYNVDDWFELRSKYRIIGEFFGITRTSSIALPAALCPEETIMLIKKGIIKVFKFNKIDQKPSDADKQKYVEYLKNLYEEQKIILRDERKTKLEIYVDQIVQGKSKKEGTSVSRDDILKEELDKLPELREENIIMPIFTEHPGNLKDGRTEVPVMEFLMQTSEKKCLIYQDLWEKGYYITCGRKFGGDFLVYLGDPISFHAVFIVKYVENIEQSQNVIDIVMYGRLGNTVKKKFVLAGIENNIVSYITLNWIDSEFH